MFEELFETKKLVSKLPYNKNYKVSNMNFNINKEYKWCGKLDNLEDLINLSKSETISESVLSNINIGKLKNIIPALEELSEMIGINDIKENIFNHVIFYLQDLDPDFRDMHHTVIKGPPGVGKTKLAGILANIYRGLGILKEGNVIKIRREDLIASYLGQTGEKTKKKLKEAIGNVLLFDEAYSLGSNDKQDSYAQQAIDQLVWFLSEHGHEFICIIAGYKKELEDRFFIMNPGLARRFPIHYSIEEYKPDEMTKIFMSIVKNNYWYISKELMSENNKITNFFKENSSYFPHFGGDINNLFNHIKKFHSKNLLKITDLNKLRSSRKYISMNDIIGGFEIYNSTNGYSNDEKNTYINMYC
jgi:energy-coupling factor transporter ATP-binding protein EcfA2